MSSKLYITSLSGSSPYTFYVCGIDFSNCTLIGTGSTTSPTLTFTLPSIFAGAPQVILKMVDNNNCETFKLLNCNVSCPFDVIIESVECDFCITVEQFEPSPTPTPSITPTITPTPSVTPTITPTPSVTPTITPTPSVTPTVTPSITPTMTVTPTPSPTCPAAASIVSDGLVAYLDPAICNGFTQATNTIEDATGNFSGNTFDLRAQVKTTTGSTSAVNYTGTSVFSSVGGGSVTINPSVPYFYATNLSTSYSAYSFSIWFYPFVNVSSGTTGYGIIEPKYYNDTSGVAYVAIGQGTGALTGEFITILYDGAYGGTNKNFRTAVIGNTILSANTWYNITCNWNSGSTRYDIYLNNVLQTISVGGNGHVPVIDANNMVLGAVVGSDGSDTTNTQARAFFNGNIGEVHAYRKSLSSAELTTNYNALKTRYGY